MTERIPKFNKSDAVGETLVINGVVGTNILTFPVVPDKVIDTVFVRNLSNNRLIRFFPKLDSDHFITIPDNFALTFSLRGNLTQFRIRTATGQADFELMLLLEGQ